MTEENKDSTRPKLRLSREPKAPQAGTEAEKAKAPEEKTAPKPMPDLRLKRPEAAKTQEDAPATRPESKRPVPPTEVPTEPSAQNKPKIKPVDPPEDRAFDPENPFSAAIREPKPENKGGLPPKLPEQMPQPAQEEKVEESSRKAEMAVDRIHEETKHKGILVSVVVIVGLLLLLGGAGYGLYYVLLSPSGKTDATNTAGSTSQPAETEQGKAESSLSRPIEKAKAVIAQAEDPERAWTNSLPETVTTETAAEDKSAEPTEAEAVDSTENEADPLAEAAAAKAEAEAKAKAADQLRRNAIMDYLQDVHIGGVRTGERAKLILNGQSYEEGDRIESDHDLRFIGFRDKKLAFRDAQGIVYIKSF